MVRDDTCCSTAASAAARPPVHRAWRPTLGVATRAPQRSSLRGLVRRVCRGVYAVAQAPDALDFRAPGARGWSSRPARWSPTGPRPGCTASTSCPSAAHAGRLARRRVRGRQRPGREPRATGSPAACRGCAAARRRRARRSSSLAARGTALDLGRAAVAASTRWPGPRRVPAPRRATRRPCCSPSRAVQGLPRRRCSCATWRRIAGRPAESPAGVARCGCTGTTPDHCRAASSSGGCTTSTASRSSDSTCALPGGPLIRRLRVRRARAFDTADGRPARHDRARRRWLADSARLADRGARTTSTAPAASCRRGRPACARCRSPRASRRGRRVPASRSASAA